MTSPQEESEEDRQRWRTQKRWGIYLLVGVAIVGIALCGAVFRSNGKAPVTPPPAPTTSTATTVTPSPSSVTTPVRTSATVAVTTTQPPPPAEPPPAQDVYYANCAAAKAAGAAPLYRGQPGYRSALDRDGDGVACE